MPSLSVVDMGPVQHHLAGLAGDHGLKALFIVPNVKAVGDDGGFRAGGVDFARHQTVAGLDGDRHLPFPVLVQRGYGDAPADEIAGFLLDGFQRALDAVEYIVQNAGTQQGAQFSFLGRSRVSTRLCGSCGPSSPGSYFICLPHDQHSFFPF